MSEELLWILIYGLSGLIFLSTLLLVFRGSRVSDLKLSLKLFTSIYEKINYNPNNVDEDFGENQKAEVKRRIGKVKAPYLAIGSQNSHERHIECSVTLESLGFLSRNSRVRLDVDTTRLGNLPGISLSLREDKENIPGEPSLLLRLKRGARKRFYIYIQFQTDFEYQALEDPKLIRFDLVARAKKTPFSGSEQYMERRRKRMFFVGPHLDDVWVGIDPGTSGSCIVASSERRRANFEQEEFVIERNKRGEEIITPSRLLFYTDKPLESSDPSALKIREHYDVGVLAGLYFGEPKFTSFQSIKKLLGYKNEVFTIPFGVTGEESTNTNQLDFNGKGLASLLTSSIFNGFASYLSKNSDQYHDLADQSTGEFSPSRAVVAIPNNFTAPQTQDMVDSIKAIGNLKEIRTIHEAEAVLLYVLSQKNGNTGIQLEAGQTKSALVVDMGGATLNTTLVSISQGAQQPSGYRLEIMARLGYGVGGDSIDWCLAQILFQALKRHREFEHINPFLTEKEFKRLSIKDKKAQKDLRLRIKTKIIDRIKNRLATRFERGEQSLILEEDKDHILHEDIIGALLGASSESPILSNSSVLDESTFLNDFFALFEKNEEGKYPILNNPLLEKYIYGSIRTAIGDVLKMGYTNIDYIIFSGRGSFFPGIRSSAKSAFKKINQRIPKEIKLSFNESKTSVAKGACFYGVQGSRIKLIHQKVYATLGVIYSTGPNRNEDLSAFSVIPMNTAMTFNTKDEIFEIIRKKKLKEGVFAWNGNRVSFYQFMANDQEGIQEIIQKKQKHRYSPIAMLATDAEMDSIIMGIDELDRIECMVTQIDGTKKVASTYLHEQNLAEENEPHYAWFVQ